MSTGKSNGFGRMLHYAVRQAEQMFLVLVGISLALAVYLGLIGSYEQNTIEYISENLPAFILYGLAILLFSSGVSGAQNNYSMLLSFGVKRRNLIPGTIIMNLILIAQTFVLYLIVSFALGTPRDIRYVMTLILGISFLLEGASKLLGIVAIKFGKVGYVVMMLILVIVCSGVGAVLGFASYSEGGLPLPALFGGHYYTGVLVVGFLVFLAANLLSHMMLRKYEVR